MAITLNGTSGIIGAINSMTATGASTTSVDFTSIPAGVKRITVMISGVSTTAGTNLRVQLGSGGIAITGYNSMCGTITAATGGTFYSSTGFDTTNLAASDRVVYGTWTFTLLGSNTWTLSAQMFNSITANTYVGVTGAVTLGGTLDRLRFTTTSGTDTFKAGTINVLYE